MVGGSLPPMIRRVARLPSARRSALGVAVTVSLPLPGSPAAAAADDASSAHSTSLVGTSTVALPPPPTSTWGQLYPCAAPGESDLQGVSEWEGPEGCWWEPPGLATCAPLAQGARICHRTSVKATGFTSSRAARAEPWQGPAADGPKPGGA